MFDFSSGELLVCVLVALVVLGPEKMHALVRSLGRWAGKAKVYMRNLSEELERETQSADIKQQLMDAQRLLKDQADTLRGHVEDADRSVREQTAEIDSAIQFNTRAAPTVSAFPGEDLPAGEELTALATDGGQAGQDDGPAPRQDRHKDAVDSGR